MKELRSSKGITVSAALFALVFIVTIAGCSNSSGINPSSSNATARNGAVILKQWEAKQILQQIYKMEQAYYQKKDTYWPPGANATAIPGTSFADINVEIPPLGKYTYTITGWYTTFMAYAISTVLDNDATLDSWYITDLGQLVVTSDDAAD